MKKLLSFNNDASIKKQYLARIKAHQLADEIIQGSYWKNGKGCAIGCTIHGSSHSLYETELGIPGIIARLEDEIFEGLANKEAKKFPLEFLKAIPVGIDLNSVWRKFLIWLLVDKKYGVIKFAIAGKSRGIIRKIADKIKLSLTQKVSSEEFFSLKRAADDVYAADAYAYAAAAYAAAAYAADDDDDDDAYVTAAYATAAAAAAYATAAAAAAAARQKYYLTMKNKLIQLLKQARYEI